LNYFGRKLLCSESLQAIQSHKKASVHVLELYIGMLQLLWKPNRLKI